MATRRKDNSKASARKARDKSRATALVSARLDRPDEAQRVLWSIVLHPLSQRVYAGLLVLLGFALLYRSSLQALYHHPRYQVQAADLRLRQPPPYVPAAYPLEVKLPPRYQGKISMFDPQLVQIVAAAYADSPWVARVGRVRKVWPNQVSVQLELRRPVCAVALRHTGFALIDEHGVRLPGTYAEVPDVGYRLPVIKGVPGSPPPPGRVWRDLGIVDGARLASLWQSKQLVEVLDLRAIDVRNVGGRVDRRRSEVVLDLGGIPVTWGRVSRPDRPDPVGVSDTQKLAILQRELISNRERRRSLELARGLDIKNGFLEIVMR